MHGLVELVFRDIQQLALRLLAHAGELHQFQAAVQLHAQLLQLVECLDIIFFMLAQAVPAKGKANA